jgi:two-component system phosphate regulon sensor histidine kinase PhoR
MTGKNMTVFKKSLLTLCVTAIGFSIILVIMVLVFMDSLYYEVNTNGLRNTARTLMTAFGEEHIAEIFSGNDSMAAELPIVENGIYRLTLIDPTGYVLWDSHIAGRLVNHLNRDEIIAALEGREASARRDSVSANMKLLYYALPVFDNNRNVIGVFRLSYTIPGFHTRISSIVLPFVIFTLVMAAAVFWVIFAFSHSLSTSIGRLVSITQKGVSLLSGPVTDESTESEFYILEKSIRAFVFELNFRLEQAKAESSRLEAILNVMSEVVFAMDNSLKLHLVNPRAREIFNLGKRCINDMSLLEATRSSELVEAAKKALAAGTTLETEWTFHIGSEKQFFVYVSPLAGVKGGVVIVMQETTRLVKLERIRKDFVANVSHELRTPIQLIKGFSETLLDTCSEKDSDNKQIVHFVEIIKKNAGIMENLTNDLLVLANLENSSVAVCDMEKLAVAVLIDEAVSSLKPQAKNKMIEINVDCPDELCANLNGSLVIQALINLIENAIKFSPAESKIKVIAYIDDGELILQVRDRGIGIPAEHHERIFERFYLVDRSRSREAGGTGLGLSIVRHIALLHKGKVEVESHAGEGSRFRIRIPVHHPDSESQEAQP